MGKRSYLDRISPVGGGGFLNNVEGTITSVRWTTVFPGTEGKESNRKTTPLFAVLKTRLDGGDKDVQFVLPAGPLGDAFVIGNDGRTLTPTGEVKVIPGYVEFGTFYRSVEAHLPEDVELRIPDTEEGDETLDFSFLEGLRVRFVQVKNEYKMEQNAKAWKENKKIGQKRAKDVFNQIGQRKGKDNDNYYDERDTQVNAVYGYVEVEAEPTPAPVAAKAAAGKGAAKATKAAAKPAATKATAAPVAASSDESVDSIAARLIVDRLAKQPTKTLLKNKINLAVTGWFMEAANKGLVDSREDVRTFLYADENLDALADAGLITYNKATQTIGLPASE